jgi:hypothetical protein
MHRSAQAGFGQQDRMEAARQLPQLGMASTIPSRFRARSSLVRSVGDRASYGPNRDSASSTYCHCNLADMPSGDGNQNFRHDVALSRRVDPRPTLENLARQTGLTYEAVVHHALVRYASSGAEALLAIEPLALRQLISARKAGEWAKVGAIIDWLEAGLESPHWR